MALLIGAAWGRSLRPLIALGQLSLSIYVAHLVAIHFWREMLVSDRVDQASAIVIVFPRAPAFRPSSGGSACGAGRWNS
jgi:peptidoglycan/LPS O-acetylase OafA/YrhL